MSLTSAFAMLLKEKLQPSSSRSLRLEMFLLEKPFPMRLEFYIEHVLDQLQMNEISLGYCYSLLEPFFNEITAENIQKLVFTALVLIYKAFTDNPASNQSLEKVGLLKIKELGRLESLLLDYIDWNLHYEMNESACRIIEGFVKEEKIELVVEEIDTNFSEYENENFSEIDEFFRF
jgi:hypothetical protein